jgi:mannose-6-phosphate isomerase-like protein (cupin superfamily)
MSDSAINKIGVTYERPWGSYITLDMQNKFQVKRLNVNPGGCLSLQRHQQRDEHWTIVQGSPTITLNETKKVFQANEQIFIPRGDIHRIHNTGDEEVIIIEIQYGDYLGEDDIERLEDIYNR